MARAWGWHVVATSRHMRCVLYPQTAIKLSHGDKRNKDRQRDERGCVYMFSEREGEEETASATEQ